LLIGLILKRPREGTCRFSIKVSCGKSGVSTLASARAHLKEMRAVKIDSVAATHKSCKKERRDISRQEKRTKPSMALAKSKGAFRIGNGSS
jgi:hypothetical protein